LLRMEIASQPRRDANLLRFNERNLMHIKADVRRSIARIVPRRSTWPRQCHAKAPRV
jgi:hypothetical protein